MFFICIPGGMQDFNYLSGDCMEITIELTCCKYPKASVLESEWEKNKESLLQTLELVGSFFIKSVFQLLQALVLRSN